MQTNQSKTQTDIDQTILDFLGDFKIRVEEDLIPLIKHIKDSLEFREYNDETKLHADGIQWKRTASKIIKDGYVYQGKACSDLVLVLITLCRATGLDAQVLKLVRVDGKSTHSIAEIKINGEWFRIDPTFTEPKPFKGYLANDQVWNKGWEGGWKVWKRGPDLWSMGLDGIDTENKVYEQ